MTIFKSTRGRYERKPFMLNAEDKVRNGKIMRCHEIGLTYVQIGKAFEISYARVAAIISKMRESE